MALDPAQALARLQGYQALGRQLGLVPAAAPTIPRPSAPPRSLAQALYPNLPSSEKDHPNG
jgi:hypothetical protein